MTEPTAPLTAERLRELLHYDPETGVFTWATKRRGSNLGAVAGNTSHKGGYRTISVDNRRYTAHRLVWLYVYGEFPSDEIDHIDRNPDNNALANLRACTRRENAYNTVRQPGATSDYRGVTWDKARRKWAAKIRMPDGTRRQLGRFDSEAEAAHAYAEARAAIDPFRAT